MALHRSYRRLNVRAERKDIWLERAPTSSYFQRHSKDVEGAMDDQSDATLSGIAATRWLALIEEHTEFLAATLHTLVFDLECAGIRVLGIPNTILLRTEIEMLKAGVKRVNSELARVQRPSDGDEHARLVA